MGDIPVLPRPGTYFKRMQFPDALEKITWASIINETEQKKIKSKTKWLELNPSEFTAVGGQGARFLLTIEKGSRGLKKLLKW